MLLLLIAVLLELSSSRTVGHSRLHGGDFSVSPERSLRIGTFCGRPCIFADRSVRTISRVSNC